MCRSSTAARGTSRWDTGGSTCSAPWTSPTCSSRTGRATTARAPTPPGGNFWTFSDIVVRILRRRGLRPANPSQSSTSSSARPTTCTSGRRTTGRARRATSSSGTDHALRRPEFVYLATGRPRRDPRQPRPRSRRRSPYIPVAARTPPSSLFPRHGRDLWWGWISGMNWHPCFWPPSTLTTITPLPRPVSRAGGSSCGAITWRNGTSPAMSTYWFAAVTFPFLAGQRRPNASRLMRSWLIVVAPQGHALLLGFAR